MFAASPQESNERQRRRPLLLQADSRSKRHGASEQCGSHGNTVALTLTHGTPLARAITVKVGLTLGHACPLDPAKPPNVARSSQTTARQHVPDDRAPRRHAALALGATGGRKIPNALLWSSRNMLAWGLRVRCRRSATPAHEGNLDLTLERGWPESEAERLKAIGYTVNSGNSAIVHAISLDAQTRAYRAAAR